MKSEQFNQLMQNIADGWNEHNVQQALDCFSDDAVYIEPPDKQLIIGKQNLKKYFDNPKPMKLVWHNLMFNEENQVGSGEFTFTMEGRDGNHGVVVVELKDEKVQFWREYYKISNLSFSDFISKDNKEFEYQLD